MKKALLVAAAVVALVAAAPASTKTTAVDISSVGFVPSSVTLQVGDSLTFTNKDTVNHQVVCQTCPFTSPVLKPGETFSFTFTKAGKFTYVDPLNKNKKGTATVQLAPAAVSVTASPTTVSYGGTTTVSGTISTQQSGEKVDILAQACGESNAKVVATVTTAAGGAFTYAARPAKNTTYQARYKPAGGAAVTSAGVMVKVRPIVGLRRLALGKFVVSVTAADSFVGKSVVFQRWIAASSTWHSVKTVVLSRTSASSTPLAGTSVSVASFRLRLKSGYRVRAVLPPAQAGSCYLAAKSATIRS